MKISDLLGRIALEALSLIDKVQDVKRGCLGLEEDLV